MTLGQHSNERTGGRTYSNGYDPALVPFLSATTIVVNPGDPQVLNRYSYVLNNPVLYIDPSGHAYDAGGAAGPSCSDDSASFLACTYPASHPLAGYWIGTTQAEADAGWETFLTGGEIVAGMLFEPADWAMTVNHWRQGDFHVLDLAGLLPFVPAAGVRALRHADEVGKIANALPKSGLRMARVVPAQYASSPTLAAPSANEAFVTLAEDIAGIDTAQGLAQRLTLVDEAGNLLPGPFAVFEFDPIFEGLASPISRTNPGFVGSGRTAGGAREFVIPNLSVNELTNLVTRIFE